MAAPTYIAGGGNAGDPTTAPTCTLGTTQAGDIIQVLVCDGGSNGPTDRLTGTSVTTGGLRWFRAAHAPGSGTTMAGSLWWARARGDHSGQTVIATTVNSGASMWGTFRGCLATGAGYDTEVLADSPAFYVRLAETSGTAAIDAIGGTAGTYTGTVALDAFDLLDGDTGNAPDFNGSNGHVTFADRAAFDRGDTFTLEAWIYMDADGVNNGIIDHGANGYVFRVTPANLLLLRKNNVGDIVTSTITLRAGMLYHVVATKSGSTVKLYINGLDVTGTVTNQTIADTALPLNIAAADGGTTDFFNGKIGRVAIYPTALSAARVLAHWRAGSVDPYDFCVATAANAASTTATGNTTTGPDRMLIQAAAVDDDVFPTGETIGGVATTRRANGQSTGGNDTGVWCNTLVQAAAGATGNYVASGITSDFKVWFVAALMPSSAGDIVEAAVTLAGAGSLAVTSKRQRKTTAQLAGAAALSAAAKRLRAGSAALAASGGVTIAGKRQRSTGLSVAAEGVMTASGRRTATSAAAFGASGQFSATARAERSAAATLAGGSDFTARAGRVRVGSVELAGIGTLAVDGTTTTTVTGAVTLAGTSSLTATAKRILQGSVSWQATAALSVAAKRARSTAADLPGSSDLAVHGRRRRAVRVTLGAAGTLGARAVRARAGAVTLAATGSLSAAGIVRAAGDLAYVIVSDRAGTRLLVTDRVRWALELADYPDTHLTLEVIG